MIKWQIANCNSDSVIAILHLTSLLTGLQCFCLTLTQCLISDTKIKNLFKSLNLAYLPLQNGVESMDQ